MKPYAFALLLGTLGSPTIAQESSELCAQIAPHMRELAVLSRQTLVKTRESLPEGIESDAMLGMLDVDTLRSEAMKAMPPNVPQELIEGLIAAATVLPIIQQATERYEVAASALEACAATAP